VQRTKGSGHIEKFRSINREHCVCFEGFIELIAVALALGVWMRHKRPRSAGMIVAQGHGSALIVFAALLRREARCTPENNIRAIVCIRRIGKQSGWV